MSHFYGCAQGNRGYASRGGSKKSGYHTIAASWDGAIEVRLDYDPKDDTNYYVVYQTPWHGKGIEMLIARGIMGSDAVMMSDLVKEGDSYQDGYTDGYAEGNDDGYKEAMGSR